MAAPWPNVELNDVFLVEWNGKHDGQKIINTMHVQCTEAPSLNTDLFNAANQLFAKYSGIGGFLDKYLACMTNDYVLEYVNIQRIQPTRAPYVRININTPGLIDGPAMPANTAVSIKRRGAGVNAHNKGHFQMGAVAIASVTDSQVNAVGQALYAPVEPFLFQAITDGLGPDSIANPVLVNQFAPFGVVDVVPILDAKLSLTVRTMHRRTVGLGI